MLTLFLSLRRALRLLFLMSFRDTENMSRCAAERPEPTARSPSQLCSSAPTPSDEISFLDDEQERVASSPQNKLEQPEHVVKRRNPGTTYAVLGCYFTGDASFCVATFR
jgi:hypothetical protein